MSAAEEQKADAIARDFQQRVQAQIGGLMMENLKLQTELDHARAEAAAKPEPKPKR